MGAKWSIFSCARLEKHSLSCQRLRSNHGSSGKILGWQNHQISSLVNAVYTCRGAPRHLLFLLNKTLWAEQRNLRILGSNLKLLFSLWAFGSENQKSISLSRKWSQTMGNISWLLQLLLLPPPPLLFQLDGSLYFAVAIICAFTILTAIHVPNTATATANSIVLYGICGKALLR